MPEGWRRADDEIMLRLARAGGLRGEDALAAFEALRPDGTYAEYVTKPAAPDDMDGYGAMVVLFDTGIPGDPQASTPLDPDEQRRVLDIAADLREQYPSTGTFVLRVSPLAAAVVPGLGRLATQEMSEYDGGLSISGSRVSTVSPATMQSDSDYLQQGETPTWFPPAARESGDVQGYIISHEFAHAALDNRIGGPSGPVVDAYLTVHPDGHAPGDYGSLDDPTEAYADAFAEWYLSNGTTTDEFTRFVAEDQGWQPHTRVASGWNEEDHPRDEHGRFTDGGGAAESPGSEPDSIYNIGLAPEREPEPPKAVVVPAGWRALEHAETEQIVRDRMKAQGYDEHTIDLVMGRTTGYFAVESYAQYQGPNGTLVLFDEDHRTGNELRLSEDDQHAVLAAVDHMQSVAPINDMVVRVDDFNYNPESVKQGFQTAEYLQQGTWGSTISGHPNITISPDVMSEAQQANFATNVLEGFHPPAPSLLDYTIAHEWGHAIDSPPVVHYDQVGDVISVTREKSDRVAGEYERGFYSGPREGGLLAHPERTAGYAAYSVAEAYAEAHADWVLSGGKSDNEQTKFYARHEGWDTRGNLKASGEYDEEEHPRDERGRWTTKDAESAGWQQVSGADAQRAVETILKERGLSDHQATYVATQMRPADTYAEYVGPNGLYAIFTGDPNSTTEADRTETMRVATSLMEDFPVPGMVVRVDDHLISGDRSEFKDLPVPDHTLGYTFTGGQSITLSPEVYGDAYANTVQHEANNFLAPKSAGKVEPVEYVLTHEWGHALDDDWGTTSGSAYDKLDVYDLRPLEHVSSYGASSPAEEWAEAFADFRISDGKSDNALTQKYADEAGWREEMRASAYARLRNVSFLFGTEEYEYSWDEDLHPRDERGRFTDKGGGREDRPIRPDPPEVHVAQMHIDRPGDQERIFGNVETRNEAAWRAITTQEAKDLEGWKEHPERYTHTSKDDYYGWVLNPGERETDAPDYHTAHEGDPVRIFERVAHEDGSVTFENERAPQSVYRVMSENEYQNAKADGFFRSDQRLALGGMGALGTFASLRSTGETYVQGTGAAGDQPNPGPYRIVRIDFRDEDGWKMSATGYPHTSEKVPFERASAVTPALDVFTVVGSIAFEFDEDLHPRDASGRFAEKEGGDNDLPQSRVPTRAEQNDMGETGRRILADYGFDSTFEQRGALKATVASEVAARMSSSTEDLVASAKYTGSLLVEQYPEAAEHPEQWLVQVDSSGYDNTLLLTGAPEFPDAQAYLDYLAGKEAASSGRLLDEVRAQGFANGSYKLIPLDSPEGETAVREGAASLLVHSWAGSANDDSPLSLAIQNAAEKEFGIRGAQSWEPSTDTAIRMKELESSEPVYRDFLRAQYNSTQDYLKEIGVKEVTLARGFNFERGSAYRTAEVPDWATWRGTGDNNERDMTLRPLSSWSSDPIAAHSFGAGKMGVTATATIPAERILSTSVTGYGAVVESEFVVLGGQVHALLNAPLDRASLAAAVGPHPNDTRNEDWIKTLAWDLSTDPVVLKQMGFDLAKLAQLPAGEAMPPELSTLIAAGDFDEDLHPRDERGRFVSKDDGDPNDEATAIQLPGMEDAKPKESAKESGFRDTVASRAVNNGHNDALMEAFGNDLFDELAAREGMTTEEYIDQANKDVAEDLAQREVVVRADWSAVPDIIQDGEFQNQFETNTSNGWIEEGHGLRLAAENEYFNIEADNRNPDDHPIYGYLPYKGLPNAGNDSATQYGDFAFVMQDSVRDRTTWTSQDSLTYAHEFGDDEFAGSQTVGDLSNPSIMGLNLDSSEYYFREPLDWHGSGSEYVEAQIHGGLPFSDVKAAYYTYNPKEDLDRDMQLAVNRKAAEAEYERTGDLVEAREWGDQRAVGTYDAIKAVQDQGVPVYVTDSDGRWVEYKLPDLEKV